MERIKKVLHCSLLDKDVVATYFIDYIKDSGGIVKTKAVEFYNCDGKKECQDKYHILDCTCFKEMKHVEHDININRK
jgi:hypothetical protein